MDLSTANLFTSTTGARGWDGKHSISATDTASNSSFDVSNPPSGLPAQDDSMGSNTIASGSSTRAKTGCITCRLRKKVRMIVPMIKHTECTANGSGVMRASPNALHAIGSGSNA